MSMVGQCLCASCMFYNFLIYIFRDFSRIYRNFEFIKITDLRILRLVTELATRPSLGEGQSPHHATGNIGEGGRPFSHRPLYGLYGWSRCLQHLCGLGVPWGAWECHPLLLFFISSSNNPGGWVAEKFPEFFDVL